MALCCRPSSICCAPVCTSFSSPHYLATCMCMPPFLLSLSLVVSSPHWSAICMLARSLQGLLCICHLLSPSLLVCYAPVSCWSFPSSVYYMYACLLPSLICYLYDCCLFPPRFVMHLSFVVSSPPCLLYTCQLSFPPLLSPPLICSLHICLSHPLFGLPYTFA